MTNSNKKFNGNAAEVFYMNDIIDSGILATDGLTNADSLVYIALVRYSNGGKDTCYPSQDGLAEKLGIEVRTIRRAIKNLTSLNFIRLQSAGNNLKKKSNVYQVFMPNQIKAYAASKTNETVEITDTREATTSTYTALISSDAAASIEDKPKPLPVLERAVVDSDVKRDDVVIVGTDGDKNQFNCGVNTLECAKQDKEFIAWCTGRILNFENLLEREYEAFMFQGVRTDLVKIRERYYKYHIEK